MRKLFEEAQMLTEDYAGSVSWDGTYLQVNIPGINRMLISFTPVQMKMLTDTGVVGNTKMMVMDD